MNMKMNIIVPIFYYLLFGSFLSCNSQEKRNSNTANDSIITDIPIEKKAERYRSEKKAIELKIGLLPLEGGFNGTQIRIWSGHARSDTLQFLTITNFDSIWSAKFYTIVYQMNDKYDSIISFSSVSLAKTPISGWNYFIDSLFKLKVMDLTDFSKIVGYNVPMDSGGPTVEIALKLKYRIYSLPGLYTNEKIWQAQNMAQIMRLIEDELQLEWLYY